MKLRLFVIFAVLGFQIAAPSGSFANEESIFVKEEFSSLAKEQLEESKGDLSDFKVDLGNFRTQDPNNETDYSRSEALERLFLKAEGISLSLSHVSGRFSDYRSMVYLRRGELATKLKNREFDSFVRDLNKLTYSPSEERLGILTKIELNIARGWEDLIQGGYRAGTITRRIQEDADDAISQLSDQIDSLEDWISEAKPYTGAEEPGRLITLTVKGYTAVGSTRDYKADALEQWEQGCGKWEKSVTALIGMGEVESMDCGTATNVAGKYSGDFLFRSNPELKLKIRLSDENTDSPKESEAGSIVGSNSSYQDKAYGSWLDKCYSRLSALKSQYGARWVIGSCGELENIGNPYDDDDFLYQSTLRIWLMSSTPQ